jgi:hypothetical protein
LSPEELYALYGGVLEAIVEVDEREDPRRPTPDKLGAEVSIVEALLDELGARLQEVWPSPRRGTLPPRVRVALPVTDDILGIYYGSLDVALREVQDWEYETRTGTDKKDAEKVYEELGRVLGELRGADNAPQGRDERDSKR